MYCYNCGNKIDGQCKFCPNCGCKTDADETAIQVSSQPEQVEEQEQKVWIKCKKCEGLLYVENEDEWQQVGLEYECNNCSEKIGVSFFGHCSHCEEFVGFFSPELGEVVWEVGKAAIKGFLAPVKALEALGRFVDEIPSAAAAGKCPFCDKKFVKCPSCTVSVEVPVGIEDSQTIICNNCNTKMRQP